jgi:GPH family glycoside/pentoside/hexuronide:cation symporter
VRDGRIPFSSKLSFGVGQFAEGLKNMAFGLFVLFYYNQVLGVSGTLCGVALGIALIFDAVTDPLAGSLSDNWHSKWGRRHPFMYASAIPLALAFYGLFSPPELSESGLFVWLLCFAVLTRAAMTLYHVPHLALGAELTQDFEERTSIVAYRQAFGTMGGLGAAVLAFAYFMSDARGGRTEAANYTPYAIALGLLMVVTIFVSAWGTQKEVPYLPSPPESDGDGVATRLRREVPDAFRNGSFRWLFAGVLIVFVMVGVNTALDLYMNEFFWALSGKQILLLQIATPVGLIVGTPLTRIIHQHWDKKPGLVGGTAGYALLQFTPVVLRLLGVFPENADPTLVPILLCFKFCQGVIVVQALVTFGSMMADVVDEHELGSGKRQEGIFFGAVAFSGKAASGVGNMVGGAGLDIIGWQGGAKLLPTDIAPELLARLGVFYGPVVAGFAVISVWCYTHYHLDRAKHKQILAELAVARAIRQKPAILE